MNSDRQIQLYLEGSLSGQELEIFRQRLKDDPAFKLIFLDYQKAWQLIEKQQRNLNIIKRLREQSSLSHKAISPEMINQEVAKFLTANEIDAVEEMKLRELLASYFRSHSRKNKRIGFVFSLAAGIILMIGIPLTFFINRSFVSSTQIYDKYFAPYPYFLHERSLTDADSTLEARTMFLYDNSRFSEASKLLIENKWDSISDPLHKLYLGICYMELKKYKEAVSTFEYVIAQDQNLALFQARWYLGLTYLKMNKKSKASEYLTKVKSDSCTFSRQAAEILERLK